jgi:hypothetical protein
MEIRISAKVFAEFVLGSPSKKSSTVRSILKPRSPEAQIPSGYYNPAIATIRGYHNRDNDESFLTSELKRLEQDIESAATPQARTKKDRNFLAVLSYMKIFSDRKWKVVSCPRIHYSSSDVRISGTPDLAIEDGKRLRLIKLGVRKEKETSEMIRLMLRVIYQGAKAKLAINPQDITFFDVSTGKALSGKSSDDELAGTIETGCADIQAMVGAM